MCSLLLDPDLMYQIISSLVRLVAGRIPVTVKMRTGFDDTALFADNLLAVQSAGAACVTIHGRTRRQGYTGRADWQAIAHARHLVDIPVVWPPATLLAESCSMNCPSCRQRCHAYMSA